MMKPPYYFLTSFFENNLEYAIAVEEVRVTLVEVSGILGFHLCQDKMLVLLKRVSNHCLKGMSEDWVDLLNVKVL